MLAGAAMLLAGGGSLKADFGWSLLVLLGVVAMIRNHIRGFARSLRRIPLQEAASDLRVLLLYSGVAWGAGAWLVMPVMPSPLLALGFALLPPLVLVMMLEDEKAAAAFTMPVVLLTAGAALTQDWHGAVWVAGIVLIAGLGIACIPAAQSMLQLRRDMAAMQ